MPTSIYAFTKRHQEEMSLAIGRAYGIPVVALRYFNTYGPRQALSNPYTGVGAIFSSRLVNGQPPVIFEDGLQSRDFIHVRDVAQATLLALESERADGEVLNVGTGRKATVLDVARILSQELRARDQWEVTNKFRQGDVRHCYSDSGKIRTRLGFEAKVSLEDGLRELAQWVASQSAEDRFQKSLQELESRRLTV
jgi:dTDP-L-rhamnose 4-epimerase